MERYEIGPLDVVRLSDLTGPADSEADDADTPIVVEEPGE